METETPATNGTATQDMPTATPEAGTAAQNMPAATPETHVDNNRVPMKRSVIAAGTIGALVVGLVLGLGISRYASAASSAAASTRTAGKLAATSSDKSATEWNPFEEIRNTQQGMDQMFDQMVAQLRRKPPLSAFADEVPGYSLSLRLKDTKDHYEVRGHLPTTGTSNVEVSLLDDQTLKVEIEDKTTEETHSKSPAGNSKVTELGQYAQILELPSPVKDEDFKVDKSKGELLITLPKA